MLALATANGAADADTDLPFLLAEFARTDTPVTVAVWDDPSVDWAAFDAVVIRSTWDYPAHLAPFLEWVRRTAAVTALWNPPTVVEWNVDKRYLVELAARGVPTVPTAVVEPGDDPGATNLAHDLVVKPTVGAGSHGVLRTRGDVDAARRHIEGLHAAGRVAMVQPYLADVDRDGETGLVYLGGEFSHAFGKAAILSRPVDLAGRMFAAERVASRTATPAERALGDAVIATLPDLAYARVDLLPTPEGPVVLELELVEPSLFIETDPSAAQRAVAVFRSLTV